MHAVLAAMLQNFDDREALPLKVSLGKLPEDAVRAISSLSIVKSLPRLTIKHNIESFFHVIPQSS